MNISAKKLVVELREKDGEKESVKVERSKDQQN